MPPCGYIRDYRNEGRTLAARVDAQAHMVADLNRQITGLDAVRTIEAPATGNLRTAAAIDAQAAALAAAAKLRAADDERRQAKRPQPCRQAYGGGEGPGRPEDREGAVDGERRAVEADLGPVKYLATLIGADNETVLRWFILVVALLLDPAAMLLLLAATRTRS